MMDQIIFVIVIIVSVVLGGVLVWCVDRLTKHQRSHFRRLEKQNMALRANLEVARAKMRQLNSRRVFLNRPSER